MFALVRNSTFSATGPVSLGLSSVERKGPRGADEGLRLWTLVLWSRSLARRKDVKLP
jgi:hypothetical protein